jgi:hypothetical protein
MIYQRSQPGLEFSEEEDLFADDDFDQTLDEEISDGHE